MSESSIELRRRWLTLGLRALLAAAATCCCFAAALVMAGDPKVDAATISKAMQGKWIVTEAELGGKSDPRQIGGEITIVGDKIYGNSKTLSSTFTLDTRTDPMHIDLFAPKGSGMAQLYGIVKVDESTLTIACGGQRPVSFEDRRLYSITLARRVEKEKR